MTISILEGDDQINKALNASFYAVVSGLNIEKFLTDDQMEHVLDKYVVVMVRKEGGFRNWFKRRFGDDSNNQDVVVMMKTLP